MISLLIFIILLIIFPPLAILWLILRLFIALGKMNKK